ncbi:C40 family peptidase [Aromatoleum toluvorans]|nr:C40 family peptidase [Aromatoleum toluvorans]
MNRISPASNMRRCLTTRFIAALAATTLLIAPPAGADDTPAPADQPAATTSSFGRYGTAAQDLINQGMEYLGIRYRFGGNSPETGLDCSGLVQNVFRNALGLNLPRAARDMASVGEKVGMQDLKPGDLVFFNTMRRAFSHVGIYVGEGRFLHAPSRGGEVRIDEMSQSYWAKRFNGARRMVPDAGLPQAD